MRRTDVRVPPAVYDDIRAALPADRGPSGGPSAGDFISMALPGLVEIIAEEYDVLPFEPTTPGVRVLNTTTIFGAVVVYATDTPDNVVHLIALELDETYYTDDR